VPTVAVGGRPVFYERRGPEGGVPLALLHGGLTPTPSWGGLPDRLARTRPVLAPERAGQGRTPDRPGPLTYEGQTADTAALLDALDLPALDVLGWSDGGMIGLRLAAGWPARVRSLAITGAGYSSAGYVPGSIESLVALPPDHPDLEPYRRHTVALPPDGPDHFAVVWEKIRTLWAQPFDWSDLLPDVTCPTLVMVGARDYVTVEHAAELARRLPRGRLVVFDGAGHDVPAEAPERVAAALTAFWEAIPDPSA
jgi:pimeloyl-ACP methyl ester carboxylesterase